MKAQWRCWKLWVKRAKLKFPCPKQPAGKAQDIVGNWKQGLKDLLQRPAVKAARIQREQNIELERAIGAGLLDPLCMPSTVRVTEEFLTKKCSEVIAGAKNQEKGGRSKKNIDRKLHRQMQRQQRPQLMPVKMQQQL